MEIADTLTRSSIRLTLLLYVLAIYLRWYGKRSRRRLVFARLAWTVSCGVCLVHVAFAFAFYHDWSHNMAYEHTARRTADMVGIDWGGGLYFNYLFLLVWIVDVFAWWRGPERYESRGRRVEYPLQIFFAFMFFNASVLFATGTGQWIGCVAFAALAYCFLTCWRGHIVKTPNHSEC